MASPRDLRRRIKSVKNTSQITKAMQMVAASKMRKAQQGALAGRPYAALMNTVLAEVTAKIGKATTLYICAGRKGSQFIARTKRQLAAEFTYKDTPLFSEARAIAKFA